MPLRSRTRSLVVPVAVAAVLGTAAPAALADELSETRQEAERIATQLEALRVEASTLDEQYNQVAVELVEIEGDVRAAEADVTRFSAELTAMRGEAGGMALTTYMNPNVVGPLTGMLGGSSAGNEAAQREGYTSVVLGVSTSLTDQLKATTDDASAAQAVLAAALERQSELQAQLADSQVAVIAAIGEHEQLQVSVQGELARLVAEEQARREAAEAEAARQREAERVAAERRRQEDEAAAAAAEEAERSEEAEQESRSASSSSQSSSSGGGGGGGTSSGGGGSDGGDDAPPASASASTSPPRREAPATTAAPAREDEEEEEEESSGGSSGGNVPSPSPGASGAVAAAMSQLGVMYRFAAAQPGVAFDCSGLTKWAWGQAGVSLPHSSQQQFAALPKIPSDQARPGDLFFFGSPIHHVGMYIGDGQMVNATQTGRPVSISNAYRKDLVGVARPG